MENAALKYTRSWNPDTANENDSLSKIYNRVSPASSVLDVGCSIGQLGSALKSQKNCQVVGVDLENDAVKEASKHLDQAYVCDILETPLSCHPQISKNKYKYIIFADVLEHLKEPVKVLKDAQKLLTSDGSILISIPNFTHASVRLCLLDGKFSYSSEGLLDRTHLFFYTKESFYQMLIDAGLTPVDIDRTYLGACDTEIPIVKKGIVTDYLIDFIEALPEATTYQFIAQVVPISEESIYEDSMKPFEKFNNPCALAQSKNSGQSLDHNTQANNSIFDFSRAQAILDEVKHLTEMFQQERLQQSSDFFKEQSLLEARIRILEQSKDIHRKIEDLADSVSNLANSISRVEDKTLRLWNILPIKLWRRIRGIS